MLFHVCATQILRVWLLHFVRVNEPLRWSVVTNNVISLCFAATVLRCAGVDTAPYMRCFIPNNLRRKEKYSVKHCFVTSFAAWEFDYYCVGIGNNFMKSNLPGVPGCSVHKLYWVDTCLSCSRSTVSRCTTGRRPLQSLGLCPTRPTGSVQ